MSAFRKPLGARNRLLATSGKSWDCPRIAEGTGKAVGDTTKQEGSTGKRWIGPFPNGRLPHNSASAGGACGVRSAYTRPRARLNSRYSPAIRSGQSVADQARPNTTTAADDCRERNTHAIQSHLGEKDSSRMGHGLLHRPSQPYRRVLWQRS